MKVSQQKVTDLIRDFFGDQSRTPKQTLQGLEVIRDTAEEYIEVLKADGVK